MQEKNKLNEKLDFFSAMLYNITSGTAGTTK
jgi:hypothetical protein